MITRRHPPGEEINDSGESDLEIAQEAIIYADTHDGIKDYSLYGTRDKFSKKFPTEDLCKTHDLPPVSLQRRI
jgi:hypothetical protein